jgi:hypothetical protein
MPFALSRQIGGWKTPDPIAHDREKIRILSDISNNFEDNLINFLEDFRFSKCSMASHCETGLANNSHKKIGRVMV